MSGIGDIVGDIQATISSGGLNLVGGALGPPQVSDAGAEAAAAEERRKAALRRKIDLFYGIKPSGATAAEAKAAAAAESQLAGDRTKIGDATRSYYSDALGRDYTKAERNTRFRLARQGLLGGSEDIFQQGEVKSDRDLGATRLDEAVRRSMANLNTQREQERVSAVNLVNAGAGDSAVSAAQAGLRNSLANVESAQKADIFGDLFANSADAVATNNLANQQAATLSRYRDRLSTFFPNSSTSGGRVTPTS